MNREAPVLRIDGRLTAADAQRLLRAWQELIRRGRRIVGPNPALERVTDGRP